MCAVPSLPRSGWRLDSLRVTAVLLPPLAVRMCGRSDLLLTSILLTLLLWVPGVIHAWGVVSKTRAERESQFVAAFRSHLGHGY